MNSANEEERFKWMMNNLHYMSVPLASLYPYLFYELLIQYLLTDAHLGNFQYENIYWIDLWSQTTRYLLHNIIIMYNLLHWYES